MKNIDFTKMRKNKKKDSKIHSAKTNVAETSGWRYLKEKNKFFLRSEYQKIYHPTRKMAHILKIAANKKWKTLFLLYVSKS